MKTTLDPRAAEWADRIWDICERIWNIFLISVAVVLLSPLCALYLICWGSWWLAWRIFGKSQEELRADP